MKSLEQMEYAEAFFKLLATKGRIRVANLLTQVDEMSVNDIARICDIEQSMCSRYLADLKKNRLAQYRRDAQINFYSLNPDAKELFSKVLSVVQDLGEIQHDNQTARQEGF